MSSSHKNLTSHSVVYTAPIQNIKTNIFVLRSNINPCSPWPPKQIPLFFVQAHNRTVKRESKTPVLGPLEFHSLKKSLRLETTHYSADYQCISLTEYCRSFSSIFFAASWRAFHSIFGNICFKKSGLNGTSFVTKFSTTNSNGNPLVTPP